MSETNLTTLAPTRGGHFPTTRWTMVAAASVRNQPESQVALAQMCESYWYPIYAFIRRHGHAPEEARDLTQGFFLQILSGTFLERADPDRGSFRAFVINAVKFYLSDAADRARAQKRGSGTRLLSFDTADGEERYLREPAHSETPERIFERRWANTILERAMEQIRQDFIRGGRLDHFQHLQPFLANQAVVPYAELAKTLAMSESALKAGIHRIRKRYRDTLRAEVAATVSSDDQIDGELRYLILALRT